MKKRKNGFTLIELLAVIIILAAIALIIAPMVLDVIKDQQKKTFKESINGILRSSRLDLVNSGLSFPAEFTYSDGKLFSPTGKELKITGKIPEGSGTIIYNSEDDIELAIHNNEFCGVYNKTSKEVELSDYTGECIIVPRVTPTPEECFVFNSSTATIVGYHLNGVQAAPYLKDLTGTINTTVTDNIDCPSDIVFPNTIDGVEVKEIGEYAFTKAEDNCYEACPPVGIGITSINFSLLNELESIGDYAFYWNELTSVEIPESVTRIEEGAFCGNQLTNVLIPSTITSIESYVFHGNQLTNVVIPNSVTSIGWGAFRNNQLISIEIPDSIQTIDNQAFMGNELTSVEIPNSVKEIGISAFESNQLTNIIISSTVINIMDGAFNDNQLPEEQAFIYARNADGSVDNATVVSYGGAERDNVIIPSNVVNIGDSAFAYNELTSVDIPSSVTSIGYSAFKSNQLTSVVIPESVTSIGSFAFNGNQLTSVTIKGKSSSDDFESYPEDSWYAPFGWASGYSDSNIIWNG